MRFKDIPKLTSIDSCYHIHASWKYLTGSWLEDALKGEISGTPLQICPEFQRGHVWTEAQQTAFIEFKLRGGRSGNDLFLNSPSFHNREVQSGGYNDFVLVDGLQRLTAVRAYMNNEIRAFGYYADEMEDREVYFRMGHHFSIYINSLTSEREVLQWYIEMNEGGTPHSKEEISRVKSLLKEAQSTNP